MRFVALQDCRCRTFRDCKLRERLGFALALGVEVEGRGGVAPREEPSATIACGPAAPVILAAERALVRKR